MPMAATPRMGMPTAVMIKPMIAGKALRPLVVVAGVEGQLGEEGRGAEPLQVRDAQGGGERQDQRQDPGSRRPSLEGGVGREREPRLIASGHGWLLSATGNDGQTDSPSRG